MNSPRPPLDWPDFGGESVEQHSVETSKKTDFLGFLKQKTVLFTVNCKENNVYIYVFPSNMQLRLSTITIAIHVVQSWNV